MENISLIPKKEIIKERRLPRFVSFEAPRLELSAVAKIGLGLIALVLVFTGGLYFWKYKLAQEVKGFNEELQRLTSQRDMGLENRLNNLNEILKIFKTVLDDHKYWSLAFDLLEAKTLNTITFKTFKGIAEDEISLDGSAPSYGALAQQVKIFEDSTGVTKVNTSDISVSEDGRVKFSLKIAFSKDLIMQKPHP